MVKRNIRRRIVDFFNEFTITNKRKYEEELNQRVVQELEILKERKLYSEDVFKDMLNATEGSQRGVKIEVSTAEAKQLLINNGWFSASEIEYKKPDTTSKKKTDVKTAMEAVTFENFYTGNFFSHSRELTPSQVRLAQDACYARTKTDPIFSGAIHHLTNYIIGGGVQISSPINKVNDVVSKFVKDTKELHGKNFESAIVYRHFIEGEQFVCLDIEEKNGDCIITFLETYQILGWEFHPKIRNLVLAYLIDDGSGQLKWIQDYRYEKIKKNTHSTVKTTSEVDKELLKNKYIIHIKDNTYPEFRGRPPGLPALRYLKYAEDFLYDRIILNHERSRVVWIRTILGRAATNLANYLAAPPAGVMLNQTEDIKYDIVNSNINAGDVKEDYLSIMYAVASAFLMPIHILNMRADEQVYASVLSAKAPFTKAIEKWQAFFGESISTILQFVIEQKIKSRVLKNSYKFDYLDVELDKIVKQDTLTTDLPVYIVFPNPVDEKLSERTTHENFLMKNRMASMRTISERNGYNYFEEKRRMENEIEEYKMVLSLTGGKGEDPASQVSDSTTKKATSNVAQSR